MGKRMKSCTENRMRAKTARSFERRDANTTEEDSAAFKDNTDTNLVR
jgi:hypothetical protein